MSFENQEVRMRTRILDEESPLSHGDRAMCEWALGEIDGLRQHLHIVSEQRDVANKHCRSHAGRIGELSRALEEAVNALDHLAVERACRGLGADGDKQQAQRLRSVLVGGAA